MLGVVTPQSLLNFWFGELTSGIAEPQIRKRWFVSDAAFDEQCAEYQDTLKQLASDPPSDWQKSARGTLALIILFDQLPRNIHRGTANAFAYDQLALQQAKAGIAAGLDRQLGWDERSFYYMPFEHSEDLFDQHIAVGLFSLLRDESPKGMRDQTSSSLRFAQKHRDIIQQFGRFPHRNETLSRNSTPEEQTFVAAGNGFGQ